MKIFSLSESELVECYEEVAPQVSQHASMRIINGDLTKEDRGDKNIALARALLLRIRRMNVRKQRNMQIVYEDGSICSSDGELLHHPH